VTVVGMLYSLEPGVLLDENCDGYWDVILCTDRNFLVC